MALNDTATLNTFGNNEQVYQPAFNQKYFQVEEKHRTKINVYKLRGMHLHCEKTYLNTDLRTVIKLVRESVQKDGITRKVTDHEGYSEYIKYVRRTKGGFND